MTLQDYLNEHRIGYAAFARLIGSAHRRNVERYAKGTRRPRAETLLAISKATNGAVTPNDFFEIRDLGAIMRSSHPHPTGSDAVRD